MMRNIIILYKDKSYKIVSANKIKTGQLLDKNIRLMMIPLYEDPNAYIPIKPSTLYNFKKVEVTILYQAYVYDMEENIGTSFEVHRFYKECDNLIDFINAIYNCYKFRGTSIYVNENGDYSTDRTLQFIMSIRQINIKFFNHKNRIFHEIDSGLMKDLHEYNKKDFDTIPPAYVNEERLNCLYEIFFIPCGYEMTSDLDNLPICIQLEDNNWRKIKKPGQMLSPQDCILYRIPDYEIYYIMEYALYLKLLAFKPFFIHYVATPIMKYYDKDYLTSLDDHKIPSHKEKREAIEAYESGDLFSISNTIVEIDGINNLLQSLIFFNTILSYIKYFAVYCYAEEDPKMKIRTFTIFGTNMGIHSLFVGDILLTDLESSYDKILTAFLEMITKGLVEK